MGIKRRTKLCGMQKVATPPTPRSQQQQLRGRGRGVVVGVEVGVEAAAFYVASNNSK